MRLAVALCCVAAPFVPGAGAQDAASPGAIDEASAVECALDAAHPAAQVLEHGDYLLRYRFVPEELSVNKAVTLLGRLCRRDGEAFSGTIRSDATMPAHGHGMNYRTTVTVRQGGHFEASGFLLHMPGEWAFTIRVSENGSASTLSIVRQVR